jgi:hypothetical protein
VCVSGGMNVEELLWTLVGLLCLIVLLLTLEIIGLVWTRCREGPEEVATETYHRYQSPQVRRRREENRKKLRKERPVAAVFEEEETFV